MENWWRFICVSIIAYLLGSINTAVMVTSVVTKGKKDIREMGSGNAGFTNVLRSVGVVPAVFTLLFDFLKGVIAGFAGKWIFSGIPTTDTVLLDELIIYGGFIGGVFAIIGHMYPVYFGFKGGKGIVTAASMMAVTDWRVFLLILSTFLLIFVFSKIISLASITCAGMYGVYTFIISYFVEYSYGVYPMRYVIITSLLAFFLGTFVIVKHKDNIKRLLKGEEKKITAKKK